MQNQNNLGFRSKESDGPIAVVAVAGGADCGRRRRRLALPMAVSVHVSVHVGATVAATAVTGGKIGEEGQGGCDEDEEERACHVAWSNYHNVGELSGPEDVSDRHHTKQKS